MPPEIKESVPRAVAGARAFGGATVAMVLAGAVALLTRQPWLFPSLGPAIMMHVEQPDKPESSPRNTLVGHLVALVAGYALLAATGLTDRPSALQDGVSGARIVAAAGSLAVTALVLVLLDAAHPPAGATTLIVSLGLLSTPGELAVAAAAVVLVTLVDLLFNRATGRHMPLWRATGRAALHPPALHPPASGVPPAGRVAEPPSGPATTRGRDA